MLKKIKQKLVKDQSLTIYFIGLFLMVIAFVMTTSLITTSNMKIKTGSKAQTAGFLSSDGLSSLSKVDAKGASFHLDLYTEPQNHDKPLYTATGHKDLAAVYEFVGQQFIVPSTVFSDSGLTQAAILPADFINNSHLTRTYKDNLYLDHNTVDHYYFNQTLSGIEIFGAQSRVDVKEGNKIIGVESNLLTDDKFDFPTVLVEEARDIALEKAIVDNPDWNLAICKNTREKRVIINRQFLGLRDRDKNCLSLAVNICNSEDDKLFDTTYYVCLSSGEVILENNNIPTVLNRAISDCSRGSCVKARSEGQSAIGDGEIDKSYDILGDIYKYYFDTFQRDSIDARGMQLRGNAKAVSLMGGSCPNAMWDGSKMWACKGMVAADVWAHEMTHGVVQYTARLGYYSQTGALNEAFADVFGYAIDSDDWTMGEDTSMGALRNFANPSSKSTKIGKMPDRLFSPNFYCGSADNAGVHHNSTVITKGLYLAVAGGDHNGCTITGIGKDKILPVYYKALTSYISSSANFYSASSALQKACSDLYGQSSNECDTVKRAIQATEIDQQGPCSSGAKRSTPACTGSLPSATATPGENVPTESPTMTPGNEEPSVTPDQEEPTVTPTIEEEPTVTPIEPSVTEIPPFAKVEGIIYEDPCEEVFGDQIGTGRYHAAYYQCSDGRTGWITSDTCLSQDELLKEATDACAQETEPTETPEPEPTDRPEPTSGKLQLTIRLRFQGVNYDNATIDALPVKVGLMSRFSQARFKTPVFYLNTDGTWTGFVEYDTLDEDGYCLLIKGPYHIQRKVCHSRPTEQDPGSYRPGDNYMALESGNTQLDFSNITMFVGDLGDQDGVVNSIDIGACKYFYDRDDEAALTIADSNLDGVVNTLDCDLIFLALKYKYDEE